MAEMSRRAATFADVGMIHRELMDLIDSMPFYGDAFKAHEKARLDKTFLRTLITIDPWHVMILEMDGVPGGFLISGPECGTVFQFWSCIFPAFRRSSLGMYGMRAFVEHFDNHRFHKASTFVRPENKVALALLKRYGYEQVALLENHIFGEDYCVMERKFTKAVEGYDRGLAVPFAARMKLRLMGLGGR